MSLTLLHLLQLADSAVPIGTASHSLGLESLAADSLLDVPTLRPFFEGHLEETGVYEGCFCRAAHRQAAGFHMDRTHEFEIAWRTSNERFAASRPARESRAASATLGRRFLQLAASLEPRLPALTVALDATRDARGDVHHALAFGLVCGALGVDEDVAAESYLHQMIAGQVSAVQRLLPFGQNGACRLLWELKPFIVRAASASRGQDPEYSTITCFQPLLEAASMRHPGLHTRLFIS
jgi:urease accessory protein